MMKKFSVSVIAAAAAFAASVGGASAATITEIAGGQGERLFGAEIKRDENVNNNAQRGHDVFLRNGSGVSGPSFNLDWGASGTVYDWSLSYNGDQASLTFAGFAPINIDVNPDGNWNAFQLFVRGADDKRLANAQTTVTVDAVNGVDFSLAAIGDEGGVFDKTFSLSDLSVIETIAGTIAFDFDVIPGAGGSPNNRLSFNLNALTVETAVVPAPAALPLFLTALAGLGAVSRRRRKS